MKILCPLCKTEVPADNIHLVREVAKCPQCHEVFSFSDSLEGVSSASRSRPAILPPSGFQVQNGPDGLHIIRSWFSRDAFFFLFFAVFWNGIVGVFVTTVLKHGDARMLLAISFHILIGIGAAYACLTKFFNKTRMSIAGNVLRITHGPLPAGRARTVQRSDVKQLYSDERIVHGKHGRSVHYGVKAILKSGGEIDLIYGLPDRKEALFIEQQVERHFGIRDEAVPGEVER